MSRASKDIQITEQLYNEGESELDSSPGHSLQDVLDQAATALDHACLTDIVIVKGDDGKFYEGTFQFRWVPVSERAAQKFIEDVSDPDKADDDEDDSE